MPTTWEPATVTAVTLSGGNLVATNTGTTSQDQGAHGLTTDGQTTGKYYFETTTTAFTGGVDVSVGIGTTASTYINMGNGGAIVGNLVYANGQIWANGGNTGATIAAITIAGTIVGIALDLDNRRIWFRKDAAGNWNGSGTANPATNTGGITIPAGTMVPFAVFGGSLGLVGNAFTANFGATAFSGAVPAGFIAGFSTAGGGAAASAQARAMVLA